MRMHLVVIDATSAAGGLDVDLSQTDVYYFAPQKNFASDGGLWLAFFSPAAMARIEEIAATDRWIPDFLNLKTALDNSLEKPDLQHPIADHVGHLGRSDQVDKFKWRSQVGCETYRAVCREDLCLGRSSEFATPYVTNPEHRSNVISTIDFDDSIDATAISKVLRAHGVVDVEPYRKLGRNQLRIATFVAIDPSDVAALLQSIDYVVEQL